MHLASVPRSAASARRGAAEPGFRPMQKIGVGGLELGPRERAYLQQVIDANRLSYGPFSQRFEQLFAELHQCRHAIFCSSGTAALHLALAALKERFGWRDGDEVIVPALTFVATSNVVLHNRLRPVFVDIDPETYNIAPSQIEAKLSPRTRAIIPVHLMGLPCDMDPIVELAEAYGLRIVEDACETMFARYRGKSVGSFGDVGCFSTYVAHYIVTGIGGLATTNDPELAALMRSLMNHGRDCRYLSIDDDRGVTGKALHEVVARRFSFTRLGYNFRASELEAAIGLAQLENREAIIHHRRQNAHYFLEHLADLAPHIQLPTVPPDRDHMFMLFPLVVRDGSRRALVNFLEERLIETRELFPLLNQPAYRKLFGDIEAGYPVARRISRAGFYIGCHQHLTEDERSYIVAQFHEFFAARRARGAPAGSTARRNSHGRRCRKARGEEPRPWRSA